MKFHININTWSQMILNLNLILKLDLSLYSRMRIEINNCFKQKLSPETMTRGTITLALKDDKRSPNEHI